MPDDARAPIVELYYLKITVAIEEYVSWLEFNLLLHLLLLVNWGEAFLRQKWSVVRPR